MAAEGIARLLAPLIERPRPFVAHPALFAPLGGAGIDPSFPSDGATAAFAIATVVAFSCRRLAAPAFAIAAMVAIGRLLVAVHYPTDVLGGTLVGVAAAVFVCRLSRLPVTYRSRHARRGRRAHGPRPPRTPGAPPAAAGACRRRRLIAAPATTAHPRFAAEWLSASLGTPRRRRRFLPIGVVPG